MSFWSRLFSRKPEETTVDESQRVQFGRAPLDPTKTGDVNTRFFLAAAQNDVAEMQRLRLHDADINVTVNAIDRDALALSTRGMFLLQTNINTLMCALYEGAFDAAMYLILEGADGTYERNTGSFETHDKKALDFLLMDHVRERCKPASTPEDVLASIFDDTAAAQRRTAYETDLFTPEQRLRLFNALVSKAENPLELVSEHTLKNAIDWGRAEIISRLKDIGVDIRDEDFVRAANPVHRPHMALQTMAAVLPYVRDVNVTEDPRYSTSNAGHKVSMKGDLAAFKWLEEQGLDKTAFSDGQFSTYAHMAAWGGDRKETEDARIAFIKYLGENGYSLDTIGRDGQTPADAGICEGSIRPALACLDAGAQPRPSYLMTAIHATHFNKVKPEEVVAVGDKLAEKGMLNHEAVINAYAELFAIIGWNEKNARQAVPIAAYLTSKGMPPKFAAEIMQEEMGMGRRPRTTFAPRSRSPMGAYLKIKAEGGQPATFRK